MTQSDSIQTSIFDFLRTIPDTESDHDPSTRRELQERAVELLTAAGMIERRVTLRLHMAGHPLAVEATVTMTGEAGLAQAMEVVPWDNWNDRRDAFDEHGDGPSAHCERVGSEQWRLTAEGAIARNDRDAGNSARMFDFVLRRGFYDDRINNAAQILDDDNLSANEKLTRIDGLIHFPPTAAAKQLGEMLGVSKQAVLTTARWRKHRRGNLEDQIERRHTQHRDRAKIFELPRSDNDDAR